MAFLILLAVTAAGCAGTQKAVSPFSTGQLLHDVRILSADSLEGRRTGTSGSKKAQSYLLGRLSETGIAPLGPSFLKPFTFLASDSTIVEGANLIGWIQGHGETNTAIVLTAHYDHLGKVGGLIVFNGADDNASGSSALLALASAFATAPLRHDLVIALLDGEEIGFRGARALMASGALDTLHPVLNVNMDMISRNEANELYISGTHHFPKLRPPLESAIATDPVVLRFGHDRPGDPGVDDWTGMSDHVVFYEAGIPFICFGVEDHPDYHRPSDDFENIDPVFFGAAVETIRRLVQILDETVSGIQ